MIRLHRFPELKVGNSDRHTVLLQSLSSERRQYIIFCMDEAIPGRTCVRASSSMRNRLAYASRLSKRDDAKKGLCWNCGKKPKSKPKPKPKPGAKSAGRNRQLEDNAGEQVISLRDHHLFAAKSGDPGSSSTEPAPEPSRLTMSSEQMEKLRASNPSISHYAWLVDSGATCHVLSDQALSLYEVVREHSGPLSTLLSASDTAMECLKVGN